MSSLQSSKVKDKQNSGLFQSKLSFPSVLHRGPQWFGYGLSVFLHVFVKWKLSLSVEMLKGGETLRWHGLVEGH